MVFLFTLLYATALTLLSDRFLLRQDDVGDFGKSENALLKDAYPEDEFLQVFFKGLSKTSGTSEVIRHAFSDVPVVLPLFSMWLFAAFWGFFLTTVKGRKLLVITDSSVL